MNKILIILLFCLFNRALLANPGVPDNSAVITQETDIILDGTIENVFHLFTPYGESLWAPEWKIVELSPQNKVVSKGFVFKPEGSESVWLVSSYDIDKYIIQYSIYDLSKAEFRVIDIKLTPLKEITQASVRYTITATNNDGMKKLKVDWSEVKYRHKILNWQSMINHFLSHN